MDVQTENLIPEGFVYDKTYNVMHGTVNGIVLLIIPVRALNQFRIQLHADIEKSGGKDDFLAFLQELKQRYPIIQYTGYHGNDTITLNVESSEQGDKDNLSIIVSELTSKCLERGIRNCCSQCKNVPPVRAAALDGTPVLLCENCFTQESKGEREQNGQKENIILGLFGAVLGVLLGAVLWVVIGMLGFIAGIAGFAMVFCGIKGYDMLGKKLSRKGIVICIVISCLMILAAEYSSLGIAIYQELGDTYYLSLMDSLALVPAFLEEPEVVQSVIKDLIIGYVLAIWASFSSVRHIWRQVEQNQKPHTVVPL